MFKLLLAILVFLILNTCGCSCNGMLSATNTVKTNNVHLNDNLLPLKTKQITFKIDESKQCLLLEKQEAYKLYYNIKAMKEYITYLVKINIFNKFTYETIINN